jgi:hypothetical protein
MIAMYPELMDLLYKDYYEDFGLLSLKVVGAFV